MAEPIYGSNDKSFFLFQGGLNKLTHLIHKLHGGKSSLSKTWVKLQGLYKKFRESGYRAVTMHFPPVFVTAGWKG